MAYINAEKLCDNLRLMAKYQYPDKRNTILGVVSTIENTPSADVVEVVRCEKCIHSEDYNGRILCNKNAHIFDKNDFCSYGTPKERGETNE